MRNLYTVLGQTAHETKESVQKYWVNFGKVKSLILLAISLLTSAVVDAQSVTATTPGTYQWVVPNGVTSITVKCYGGGGGGGFGRATNGAAGGGGGGGAYASSTITVTPGSIYTFVVGAGGAGGTAAGTASAAGGNSIFGASQVVAAGGSGGAGVATAVSGAAGNGGSTALSIGSVLWAGGNGAAGVSGTVATSGGGGGGAAGNTAAAGASGVLRVGGTGVAPSGNGGSGAANAAGTAGTAYGAGGAGGHRNATNNAGGAGAAGAVIITYTGAASSAFMVGGVYASSTLDEDISNVTVGSMNNSSNCTTVATGPGSVLNRYANYFGVVTGPSAQQSSVVNFSLTMTTCGGAYSNFFQLYLDWNADGDWLDAGEQVYSQGTSVSGSQTVTGSFTVPATAYVGTIRMRVVNVETTASTTNYTSSAYSYGETEDYPFTVTVATACSGTPNTGTATISSATGCPSTNFNLSASGLSTGSGISYQWQTSASASGPWSNITGATSSTYTASTASTAYYKLVTTCSASSTSNSSNVVSYTVASNPCACGSYAASSATSTADDEILNVTLGTLNNTSALGALAPGAGSVAYMYSNYTGSIAAPTLQQTSSYPLSVTVGMNGATAYSGIVTVYIDYNQNGLFTDAGELVYTSPYTSFAVAGTTVSTNITIPITATVGITRMRVIEVESSTAMASTGTYSWGETEDYCVNITAAPSCTGTPNTGTASISSTGGCAPGSVTLSATGVSSGLGITYQWQSSSSASGPWANITGATSTSYVLTTSVGTTYYKLVTTCSSSSSTNSSNAVSYVGTSCASNIVPSTGSNVISCGTSTMLYDNGGAAGDYVASSSGYTVLDNSGSGVITLSGSFTYVETNWDYLRIYSGIGTGGTLLATYTNSSGGTITPYTSPAGTPITVQFTSDGSGQGAGFAMQVVYSGTCAPACVPTGDEITFGAGSWIGYVYDAATASSFTTYKGIVTEATTFNRTHTTIAAGATAPHCSMNSDLFTIRYKNTTNFPAGYYTFTIGGDDGVRLSLDGGVTWHIGAAGAPVAGTPWGDHGYTTYSSTTPIYLSGNTNMVFEYYENTGGAQSSFSYIFTPACSGTPTPGNTLASATVVTSGGTSNLSLQNSTAPATYQWQSATSSTGPWTSISGATAATYTATVTAMTWYQCVVTCTTTSTSAASNPIQITLAYCASGATTTADEEIYNVTINGGSTNPLYANANGCTTIAPGPGSVLSSYSNFTTLPVITTVNQSQTVSFSIAQDECDGATYYANGCSIWIDWNQDADFNDAGEQVFVEAATATGPRTISGSFVVPPSATPGNTRMRVMVAEGYSGATLTPCLSYGYGETEDHLINIAIPPACSGTPAPGATTASSTSIFAGGTSNLGVTTAPSGSGITYVWQSSSSASGPWTTIAGATSYTYTAAPTASTYYQCIVTCSTGSVSGTSTPILISVNPYCQPTYTYGTTAGDLISNVVIAGTALSNNTGTTAGTPAYQFYTGQPNYTANMVAANSYNVSVTAGSFTNQNFAAWIDYNDNNVFEASELIGFSSAATTAAFQTVNFTVNLSCTPPLGQHRLRIRGVYATAGSTLDPCLNYGWGETEDYLITIVPGPAFTPAFTTVPAATSCVGTTVNYVATSGQTNYTWTFAGTAGTDYTLVSGGTSTSNTASVTWITGGAHSVTMNYASPLGCASSGAVSNTVTMPTAGTALSQNNENATCVVNQNGWVHFYHSSGRLIGSINSQGQNLGAVTVTSYVDPTNALVPACTNPNPIYSTSVMQRHWVITPTNQPTTAVLVRFPYSNAEFSGLTSAASTNANPNDDLLTPADLGMTKYSNGTAANVNADPTDNCGVGTSTFHTQMGTGLATSYSGVTANYVDFSIPGFSEFWLHGSSTASPLPVELVNFQANCAGEGKVEVTWATASEHNSANFTVEKSRDGINWTVLSSVAGAGNSTQMINYSVMDNNAASGVNYYRLTQTDFDGASETFNIASANCGDNSPLTTVKVYPNPSAGDFYIDFTSEEITGASVITITDARGMAVYKQDVTITKGSNVFHIENMEAAPGMYYIQVSNGTATSNIVKHSLR